MDNSLNWDLSSLYSNDKELDKELIQADNKAKEFQKKFQNKIQALSIKEFENAIWEYENISESIGKILSYVFLEFATDSSKGAKLNLYQQKTTKISNMLLFFELEFNKIKDSKRSKYIKNIKKYRFYLQNIAKEKKVLLIASGKSVTEYRESIEKRVQESNYLSIALNHKPTFECDYYFFSNQKRFDEFGSQVKQDKIIITSNIAPVNNTISKDVRNCFISL